MLGALLGIGQQLVGQPFVLFRRGTARTRAGERTDGDGAVTETDEGLAESEKSLVTVPLVTVTVTVVECEPVDAVPVTVSA